MPIKRQGLIVVVILLAVITVIPALIVIPFSEATSDPVNLNETQETELDLTDQPVVRVKRSETDEIEEVPLEKYVVSVVASEVPANFEMEAIKAQALAARTFVIQHLNQSSEEEFDVTDTVNHQVYKNFDELRSAWGVDYSKNINKIKQAVQETNGQIITYSGKPIAAQFFSTSNGYTENAEDYWQNEIPYLKSVSSPWDEQSPEFLEQQVIPLTEVVNKLGLESSSIQVSNTVRTESSRIKEITINNKTFTGREVRELLGLRSNDFTIETKGDHIIFTTKGYGHGVGMSQYGANGMAEEGQTYKDIVKHYYQGVEIANVQEVMGTLSAMN
ncbi:stage II sporulation protein D [Tenuibacillus multivorans]|uniref:Stage II sporulation protein D n=1 Tax=Tenuibacillus multivorans TaxID=237069 RepID=A0A1G9X3K4_9BACI|nr:stage II sporulation protein D [Tenuibacillus multivorans]GEL77241.1 stage II sporulation protein D [Tenuibacillus multivorans]SDM91320.1 stage II sporulation protein D [Tenuibacillus multivorans]